MDCLPDNETLLYWLTHYGSITLFVLLAIGIIAVPVPEETLMVIAGAIMEQGKLPIAGTIIAAYAGSICGITMSYMLGRTAGIYFIHKYGSWLGLTEQRLQIAHNWFEKYGKWTLLIGYFIPGVRHFTGFSAGTTGLEFRQFAIYAYSGAIFWVTTFLSIGYFFGTYCFELLHEIEFDTETVVLGLIVLSAAVYLVYLIKKK